MIQISPGMVKISRGMVRISPEMVQISSGMVKSVFYSAAQFVTFVCLQSLYWAYLYLFAYFWYKNLLSFSADGATNVKVVSFDKKFNEKPKTFIVLIIEEKYIKENLQNQATVIHAYSKKQYASSFC